MAPSIAGAIRELEGRVTSLEDAKTALPDEFLELKNRVEDLEAPRKCYVPDFGEVLMSPNSRELFEAEMDNRIRNSKLTVRFIPIIVAIAALAFVIALCAGEVIHVLKDIHQDLRPKEMVAHLDFPATTGTKQSDDTGSTTMSAATTTLTAPVGLGYEKQHDLEIMLDTACWLRVTDQMPATADGRILPPKVLLEGQQKLGFYQRIVVTGPNRIEVRAGCPGAVHYIVDGKPYYPDNESGTPSKSEVDHLSL
jgi:hypothetical protein